MGAFLAALGKGAKALGKRAGKGAKAYGKMRLQQKGLMPSGRATPSSGSAGSDPVAEAVAEESRSKKRSTKERGG